MKNPFAQPKVNKRESIVERYLVREVTRFGGQVRKVVFPGHVGAPDRVVMFPGVLVWVELKSATGKLTPMQEREHARFREMGQWVEILRTRVEVDKLVEELYGASQREI